MADEQPEREGSADGPQDTPAGRGSALPARFNNRLAKGLVGLLGLALLVAAGLWWRKRNAELERAARWQAAGQAWADASACIIGEPLAAEESLVERLRLYQLAEVRRSHPSWPASCASHVQQLYDSLDFDGLAHELKQALIEKFSCDRGCEVTDPVREMTGLAEMVQEADLPVLPPRVEVLPRVKAKLLRKAAFERLAGVDARVRDRAVLDDGSVRLLLASRRYGLQMCKLNADDAAPFACDVVSTELAPTTVKLIRIGDELLLQGRLNAQARRVVTDHEGKLVALKRGLRDGFALQQSGSEHKLSRISDGKVANEKELSLPEDDHGMTIVDRSLLWVHPGEAGSTLMMRPLLADKKVFGAEQALGPLPSSVSRPLLCKSGEERVALYGPVRRPDALVFFDGSSWSAPVLVPEAAALQGSPAAATAHGAASASDSAVVAAPPPKRPAGSNAASEQLGNFGMLGLLGSAAAADSAGPSGWGQLAPPPRKSRTWTTVRGPAGSAAQRLPNHAFACGRGEAVLTWRIPGPEAQTIAQLRCTPRGCQQRRAVLANLSVKSWWTAATLDDKVLVVWRTEQGDLRRRLAPIEQLAAAPDMLVMDSEEHGGPITRDLQAAIGRHAVVFLFSGDGLNGLRFDADGGYEPVVVQH